MKGTAVGELRGRIVKGVGGFYYVNAGGTLYECKARGKFRVENMTPMVGDEVLFAPEEGKPKGYLSEILPRKNAMLRPPPAPAKCSITPAGGPSHGFIRLIIIARSAGLINPFGANTPQGIDKTGCRVYPNRHKHERKPCP